MTFIPPYWYYTEKVVHPKPEIDYVIDVFKKKISVNQSKNISSYSVKNYFPPEVIWSKRYLEIVENIVVQVGLRKSFKYRYESWGQLYTKGLEHDYHNHNEFKEANEATISFVHFIKNGNEPNFRFINLDTDQIHIPKQEEGDILIFPSYLFHKVIPNKSDKNRFVISGNIAIINPQK